MCKTRQCFCLGVTAFLSCNSMSSDQVSLIKMHKALKYTAKIYSEYSNFYRPFSIYEVTSYSFQTTQLAQEGKTAIGNPRLALFFTFAAFYCVFLINLCVLSRALGAVLNRKKTIRDKVHPVFVI